MGSIRETFESLRLGNTLTQAQTEFLESASLSSEQQASALAALSIKFNLTQDEIRVRDLLSKNLIKLSFLGQSDWVASLSEIQFGLVGTEKYWLNGFYCLTTNKKLGKELINELVRDIKDSSNNLMFTAAFLMFVCRCGLDDDDLVILTKAMANSGQIYDYRNHPKLNNAKVLRRYPTGALSEKSALILPAIIAVAREVVNVASPFLVAKSLGFTGGTWDKLSSIKSFKFPLPGEETLDALNNCGVAMTVTLSDLNPVDRILYQLRSFTGTIESHPLIISSIASKHLSIPVDRLLMDIRYGEGAFLATESEALNLGNKLIKVLNDNNVPSFYETTDTSQPTGSSIGNSLELAEAIEIMSGETSGIFNVDAMKQQIELVTHFFGLLMAEEFPIKNYSEWKEFATTKLSNKSVLNAFRRILITHKVPSKDADDLISNPISFLNLQNKFITINSQIAGTLKRILQKDLGEIVYNLIGAANNQFAGEFKPNNGVIILPRINDQIKQGDVIARLIYEGDNSSEIVKLIQNCFVIE